MPTIRQASLPRLVAVLAIAFLVASTAGAALFTVTLENGTTFETRDRPVIAEWDENYAMFRTNQGNWIALPKDDIIEVTTDMEATGFGYQADTSTLYLGWTPGDYVPGEDEEGAGTPPGQAPPPPDDTPIQYGGDSGNSSYGMDQFLDIPVGGGSIDTMNLGPAGQQN